MEQIEGNNRQLSKWVVRLAYLLQLQKQRDYIYDALVNDELQADLDLTIINDSLAKEVKLKAFRLFEGIPGDLLDSHGVNKNQEDFDRLFEMPLNKYILMDEDKLSHFTW